MTRGVCRMRGHSSVNRAIVARHSSSRASRACRDPPDNRNGPNRRIRGGGGGKGCVGRPGKPPHHVTVSRKETLTERSVR